MASFAKAQLLKYGWTEGKGLGKNENGIVDALKPKLKFDTTGVGHDSKEHKWWETVYNKAANNVEVDARANEVFVKIKDEDAVEITTKKFDLKKLKKTHNLQYGSFLKTCTLDDGKVVPDENLARTAFNDVVYEAPSFEMSDEKLFEACGGRTAHKGARHGLNLSGKLARIHQQELELLGKSSEKSATDTTDWQIQKKSKRKRCRNEMEIDRDSSISNNSEQTDANANTLMPENSSFVRADSPENRKKSKSTRRKDKRRVQDLVHQLGSFGLVEDSSKSEKNKNERDSAKNDGTPTEIGKIDGASEKSSRKKSRKNRENGENVENEDSRIFSAECTIELADGNVITIDDESEESAKTSKKRKRDAKEAEKLNNRIAKKKTKHHAKKEKRRVDRLSECLMAVNLCEDSVDSGRGEDLVEVSRKLKKWKKHKKEKKDKKLEDIIILDS